MANATRFYDGHDMALDYFTEVRAPAMSGLFGRLFRTAVLWNAARQTRDQLMKLNDRELSDIGLRRDEIDGVARRIWRA